MNDHDLCPNCGESYEDNGGPTQRRYDEGPMCDLCCEAADEAEDAEREELGTDYDGSVLRFAGPGSALRAASASNPRNLPCPNCRQPNRLTPKDKALGYQCDECADRTERGCD